MQVINIFYYKNKNLGIKSPKDNILSHNSMATFFSGTDTATLREEGNKRNHFVSLIVNNAGTYTAGITRKIIESKVLEEFKYGTFNGDIIESKREYDAVDTIEWCNLEVIKEGTTYSFRDLDERLEEIKKSKEAAKEKNLQHKDTQIKGTYFPSYPYYHNGYQNAAKVAMEDIKEEETPTLFDDLNDVPFDTEVKGSSEIKFSDEFIHSLVLQLITGSIAIADESKIVPSRWAASMEKIFDKRFSSMKMYNIWAEQLCEFILCYSSPNYQDIDEIEYCNALSTVLMGELSKLPENKYIKSLKDCLALWIA